MSNKSGKEKEKKRQSESTKPHKKEIRTIPLNLSKKQIMDLYFNVSTFFFFNFQLSRLTIR